MKFTVFDTCTQKEQSILGPLSNYPVQLAIYVLALAEKCPAFVPASENTTPLSVDLSAARLEFSRWEMVFHYL